MSNSHGNTNRDIRRFLREHGVPATARNVELIGREVRRTEAENERVQKEAIERGEPTRDAKGPIEQRVRDHVARKMRERGGQR